MKITWLADVLSAAGLTVVEHTNWKTHDRPGDWDPKYIVVHATAAPRSQSDDTQVRIVRDGRSDLQGPIANAVVDRRGRWHVLSAGRCNTTLAGTAGPYKGLGNTNALGIEACNDNGLASPAEKWPTVQYESYVDGVAAICRKMKWSASHAVGHKEHCPGRKTDPTFGMPTFRTAVTKALTQEDDVTKDDIKAAMRELLMDDNDPLAAELRARPWQYTGGGLQGATSTLDALSDSQGIAKTVAELSAEVTALAELVAQLVPQGDS